MYNNKIPECSEHRKNKQTRTRDLKLKFYIHPFLSTDHIKKLYAHKANYNKFRLILS